MSDEQNHKENKIPLSSLIPLTESLQQPGLLLLLKNGDKLYLQSLKQIDQWPDNLKFSVANHLNLLFRPLHKDRFGNVCFADEPHLRPEYRSHFTPADLFDYYYALWQISDEQMPENTPTIQIRFPDPAFFWDFVKTGMLLRSIHLSSGTGQLPYKISPDDDPPDSSKFSSEKSKFIADPNHPGGNLYLNEKYYLENIPSETYQYNICGYYPVKDWIKNHHNRSITLERIHQLSLLIAKIEQTSIWQKELKKIKAGK